MTQPVRIPYDEPQTWYFTFGFDHVYANGYIMIDGVTGSQARSLMVSTFGTAWAFQYDAHDWFEEGISQAEKWNLRRVPLKHEAVG